jgi:hypothetical protein
MESLSGKISDKLRAKFQPDDQAWSAKRQGEAPPSAQSVRDAGGQGLGQGATRRRSGEGSEA